ncbi:hypothetical protein C1T31_09850 [Hanstruepera neustonica]|uniref:HYR domain-containing protein n=1 Tax=Hanstruepera neustonica TaxID=1445657 RepID=A0A2K1DXP5_9FLAO|nr:HYR domain-containing protein [Hanstruepera neustonica]PNQ72804.1 hypothetical protein C1T31_09850 [Hanstruepera neustonica]
MKRFFFFVIFTLVTFYTEITFSQTTTITIGDWHTGWYQNNGYHDSFNTNYLVGPYNGRTYHNFFIFNLNSLPQNVEIISAQLSVISASSAISSSNATYTLFNVSSNYNTVRNSSNSISVWNDLGSGPVYGSYSVNNSTGFRRDFNLNATALNELESQAGNYFTIGGRITSGNGYIFGGSGYGTQLLRITYRNNNVPPVVTCPSDLIVENLPESCGAIAFFGATDTAGIPQSTITYSHQPGDFFPVGITTVTATATNSVGSDSCTFDVVVEDTEAPVLTCPANQVIVLDAACDGVMPDYTVGVATDNCGVTVTQVPAAGTTFNGDQVVSVTLTADDNNGNTVDCTFDVHFDDQTPPVLTCLADQVVVLDATCDAVMPDYTDGVATDNCGVTVTQVPAAGTAFNGDQVVAVILTADDGNGNVVDCTFDVHFDDQTPPVLNCPADQVVVLDATCDAIMPYYTVGVATDNCGVTVSQIPAAGTAFNGDQVVAVTLTADDGNGNSVDCTFDVHFDDQTPPVLTCPADQVVVLDTTCDAIMPDYTIGVATDNCGVTVSQIPAAGTAFNGDQVVAVILTADDGNGNVVDCTFNVHFDDQTPPVLTCPADQVVVLDATCDAIMPDYTVGVATDNCGVTVTQVPAAGTAFSGDQVVAVILTADDGNGNSVDCTFDVHFDDQTPPVLTCPADQVVVLDATCDAIMPDYTVGVATDNCGVTVSQIPAAGTVFSGDQVVAVTLNADDGNGNSVDCTFDVHFDDQTPPVISCVPNTTFNTDPGVCDYTVVGSELDASFTDNCSSGSITNDYNNDASLAGAIFPQGTTVVTWTVDDGNGQIVACTTDVIVEDNEAPIINCGATTAQNLVINNDFENNAIHDGLGSTNWISFYEAWGSVRSYDQNIIGSAQSGNFYIKMFGPNSGVFQDFPVNTGDNITGKVYMQNASFDPTNPDGWGQVKLEWLVGGSIVGVETSPFFTSASSPQDVWTEISVDATAPVGVTGVRLVLISQQPTGGAIMFDNASLVNNGNTSPGDITVNNDLGQCGAQLVIPTPAYSDNCSIASITNDYTGTDNASGFYPVGTTTVNWTVVDQAGLTATCSIDVTVIDNEAPVVNCLSLQVQLDEFGNGSISEEDINGDSTDNCEIASIELSQLDFDCSDIGGDLDGLIISEYVDGAGDNDCVEIFNGTGNEVNLLGDNYVLRVYADGGTTALYEVPLLGTIADRDVYVLCFGNNDGADQADQIDGFGFDGNDAVALVKDGNAVDVVGVIGTNPGTGWSSGGVTTAGTTLVRNVDVLQGNINAFVANLSSEWTQFPQGTYGNLGAHDIEITDLANNVILTVTDTSGNVSTCEGNVTVVDMVPPVPACQDITVQLGIDGTATVAPSQVDNGSDDACGIATLELDVTEFDCSNIGANPVVLTVTDVNGNTATCNATVTIEDNVAPTVVTQNITVQLDDQGNASIEALDVDGGSTDACGIDTYAVTPNSFDCSNIGDNTVTLTVTDIHGNAASETAVVTVEDMVNPIAVCNDISIYLNADGTYTLSQSDIDAIADGSTDNCDTDLTYSVSPDTFTCAEEGDNTVTLTVTDDYGNASTCTATVTVDGSFPEVTITQSELPEFCQGAVVVLTANSDEAVEYLWNSGEETASIEVGANGIYGVLVTSATNCTAYAEFEVTGFDPGSLTAAYTIIAEEEVYLHGNNLVQTGGVGAMDPNVGNIKLHQATTVVGFGQAVSFNLNQGSTVGSQVFAPANPTIPSFVFNTLSNNSSPDATVNNNQTQTLTGSVYDVVTVKQNATVIFTQSNVYINELKTFDGASIEFENCANVFINEKFMLAQNGTINADDPNKVVLYVNQDVQIEKGSYVRASIHAYFHELMVKGDQNGDPTYMTGLFIANRVHGNKNTVWNADDLCDPCPVDQPVSGSIDVVDSSDLRMGIDMEVSAWPNPSNSNFNLRLKTAISNDDVQVEVFDMNNRLVHKGDFSYDGTHVFGDKLDGGVYIVKVTQSGITKSVRLVRY